MTERTFPEVWPIVGSTHEVFPSTSVVRLTPQQTGSARFDFFLDSQKLFDADFPEVTVPPGKPGTFEGTFNGSDGKSHVLKVTVFPRRSKQVLCGLLFKPGREEGPTGVWVAEEQRPPEPPRE